jgi:aryl-alcohol dehydrogenase-like predicted oxidoreductase
MIKKIIYGMAKLCDVNYGYGSTDQKIRFRPNKILKYLNNSKLIQGIEVSKRYKNSLKHIAILKKKKIHYKIDNIPKQKSLIKNYINKDVKDFFNKTNIKCIEVLYLHQNNISIISNPIVLKTLAKLVREKKVKYIGVSIYNKQELDFAIKSKVIKVIQMPVNIADSYLYSKIKKNKKIIVARSIFLQGALINNISKHPKKEQILNYKKKIHEICKQNNITYLEAITSYVFNLKMINYVLISTISKKNLSQIFKSIIKIDKKTLELLHTNSKKLKSWANTMTWGANQYTGK